MNLNSSHVSDGVNYQDFALSAALKNILLDTKQKLGGKADYADISEQELKSVIESNANKQGFQLNNYEKDLILEHLRKDHASYGILQSLIDDQEVNDIVVVAYDSIRYQKHRRNYISNLQFDSHCDYLAFVEVLLNRASATYSNKVPIVDCMLSPEIRLNLIHESLCSAGPLLTLRINRHNRISITALVNYGLLPEPMGDYLTSIIQGSNTILIAGEVGTGKTTLARALANVIPEEQSILVIEDTPEIKLEHPHVRYIQTRSENTEGIGCITASECIRAGMRMAMNRIIFGEIRDAVATESFIDVCSSGHAGITTIHARSVQDSISRLELFLGRVQQVNNRETLSTQIANALQVIVQIGICPVSKVRRIVEVAEIGSFADRVVRRTSLFKYEYQNSAPCWKVSARTSQVLSRQAVKKLSGCFSKDYLK